ncbi:MAG: hypothetical protein NC913_06185 [Candidatus Omnitrophica bacterium]|nr:hypothetical protein [Candidatus Omnitrophota bacterium]
MLVENPLYTALRRIQTRPLRIFSMIAVEILVIGIIFLICLWNSTDFNSGKVLIEDFGRTFSNWMIALQYIAIVIIGTFSIESRIVRDRISEIINFHRLTQLSPSSIIVGYITGSTFDSLILWLILFFAGIAGVLLGGLNFSQYLASSLLILFCAAFFYILAVWSGLNKSIYLRSGARQIWGFASILTIFSAHPAGTVFDLNFLSSTPAILYILRSNNTHEYFPLFNSLPNLWGVPLLPVLYTLCLWASFGTLFWFSSIRKIPFEDSPKFSKKETLWAFSIFAFFITGRISGILEKFKETFILSAGVILVILLSFALLIISIPERINLRRYLIKLQMDKTIPWYRDDMTSLQLTAFLIMLSITAQVIIYIHAGIYISLISKNISHIIFQLIIFALSMFFILFIVEGCRMKFSKNQDSVSALIIFAWFIAVPIVIALYISKGHNSNYWLMGLSPTNFFVIPEFVAESKLERYSTSLNIARIIAIVITAGFTYLSFLFWKNSRKIFKMTIFTKEKQK